MPRRGENIYKRGDGRWEGRYIRGRTPEGRAQYGYVYAATYSACREKRRQRLRELPREITPSNNMSPLSAGIGMWCGSISSRSWALRRCMR